MTERAIRRAELAAELGSSASSATLRNLVAELESLREINGLTKFRKFRSETLRNLPAELETSEPAVSQCPPELSFSGSLFTAHFAGEFEKLRVFSEGSVFHMSSPTDDA